MTEENSQIKKIKETQATFRSKFQVLKDAKASLLKLFRQKLEEKKTEELRKEITNSPK